MKFVGKGLLLEVAPFVSKEKDKDGNFIGEGKQKFKYTFLVGDQKDKKSFIENAHVESCVSDHVLLNGDEKVFDEIDIEVDLITFKQKVNGQLQDVTRPQYQVVDKIGVR